MPHCLILNIFSPDSTRLLVGFARGQLIEYDITSGKIYRDLSDIHPPGRMQMINMVDFENKKKQHFLCWPSVCLGNYCMQ
jgi:hypothetical protein